MKVLFVVRTLGYGGAEIQLARLASGLAARGHTVSIAAFQVNKEFVDEQIDIEVRIVPAEKIYGNKILRYVEFVRTVRSAIVEDRFEVVYSFLPLANLLSLLASRWTHTRLVWGVRSVRQVGLRDELRIRGGSTIQGLVLLSEKLLSRFPHAIIVNSEAGQRRLAEIGYRIDRIAVVHNGIDTNRFVPDLSLRRSARMSLGLADQEILIGIVAKIAPVKGHDLLIAAAGLVKDRGVDARYLVIGGPTDSDYASKLKEMIAEKNLVGEFVWLGARSDTARWMNAVDILVSASYTEGFSNSVAEGLACGCATIVTDVGDSCAIVGGYGKCVPPHSPSALAAAVRSMIDELPKYDSAGARRRVESEFSVVSMVAETERILQRLVEA